MPTKNPQPKQEELFVSLGDIVTPRQSALPEGEFDEISAIIEPHVLLINALSDLREASKLNGFVTMSTNSLAPGDEKSKIPIDSAKLKRGQHTSQAQTSFEQAVELLRAEGVTDEDLKALGMNSLTKFITSYYGPNKHSANIAMAKLIREAALNKVEDLELSVSVANRKAGKRPHKAKPKPKERELQQLDTQQKLQALKDDKRAGFLPTTNKEKTQVMAFLDYLDNPKYPLGINNQFGEIFNHQEREKEKQKGGIPGGPRSIESIVYEFGDYFTQSAEQLVALRDLETKIADCDKPTVTLIEQVGSKHPAYAPLTRYLDLVTLRERGIVVGINDPLTTKTNRWGSSNDPGKHKTVHDQYTQDKPSPIFTERIQATVASLTIGEMRKIIRSAVTDQTKRHQFMQRRLRDATKISYSPRYAPKWVLEADRLLRDQELVLV